MPSPFVSDNPLLVPSPFVTDRPLIPDRPFPCARAALSIPWPASGPAHAAPVSAATVNKETTNPSDLVSVRIAAWQSSNQAIKFNLKRTSNLPII